MDRQAGTMLIGPQDCEQWDIAFIAEYPSVQAFVDMLRDPVYREAVKHRQAGVADLRLLLLQPAEPGKEFGEASQTVRNGPKSKNSLVRSPTPFRTSML